MPLDLPAIGRCHAPIVYIHYGDLDVLRKRVLYENVVVKINIGNSKDLASCGLVLLGFLNCHLPFVKENTMVSTGLFFFLAYNRTNPLAY